MMLRKQLNVDQQTTVHELKKRMKQFCEERDWDRYHNAKDLAIALSIEASELLEHFRFKPEETIDTKKEQICEELADVLSFVLRLAQKYDIDLTTELSKKMKKNADKYPVDKCLGKEYKKYNENQ